MRVSVGEMPIIWPRGGCIVAICVLKILLEARFPEKWPVSDPVVACCCALFASSRPSGSRLHTVWGPRRTRKCARQPARMVSMTGAKEFLARAFQM